MDNINVLNLLPHPAILNFRLAPVPPVTMLRQIVSDVVVKKKILPDPTLNIVTGGTGAIAKN